MRKLIIINGTMGAGKSTVSNLLFKMLEPSVFLDGDWCWNMNPFVATEENKAMVGNNISYMLKSFINNSSFKYVIFCWVIHQENIFDLILNPIKDCEFELHKITLMCSEDALRKRMLLDVKNGVRAADGTEHSVRRLPLYENMDTVKIDVSNITAQQAAEKIAALVK